MSKHEDLFTIGDAARYLALQPEQVRWFCGTGKLEVKRTIGGARLLTLATLTAFAKSPAYLAARKRHDAATARVKARVEALKKPPSKS